MAKSKLLTDALADAKTLKASAQALAKLELQETFQPTLQRMISSKLAEEDGEEEFEDDVAIDVNYEDDQSDVDASSESDSVGFGSFEDEEESPEAEGEEDIDLELESLLRELDGEGEFEEEPVMEEGEEESWQDPVEDPIQEGEEMDDMELEEAINAILEEEGLGDDLDWGEEDEDGASFTENPPAGPQFLESKKLRNENKKLKKDLNEAYQAVTTLKKTLNEVNLLNAKLMYTTKTFKQFDLNEAQQERILDSFDRATTVREVKLIYSTIVESRNRKPIKRKVSEGLASKSVNAINPNKQKLQENSRDIVGEDFVQRMQRLSGIKRNDHF